MCRLEEALSEKNGSRSIQLLTLYLPLSALGSQPNKDTSKDFAIHRQFMRDTILPHYKELIPGIRKACIVTDNCAGQYRNKDNYSFVADMKQEFEIECTHIFPGK
jgi:hypothetical protein